MKKFAEVKEFNQLFLPAAAVLAVGLTAGIILAILVVQKVMNSSQAKQLESVQSVSASVSTASRPIDTIDTPPAATQAVEPAPAPAPVSKPKPTPAPASKASVVISDDGCSVTATGNQGMQLTAGATNGRKGGDITYTLPDGGTLTVSAGGMQGFSSYAYLYDASGAMVASATGTITPTQCEPPLVP